MSNIDKQIDDYTKAIDHLNLEIDRLGRTKRVINKRDGRNE